MMIMFGRVYGAVIAALIFAICTVTKLPFMQSIIFTVVLVLVLGIARPHILKVTSAITERAVALQQSLQARFTRKPRGARDASGARDQRTDQAVRRHRRDQRCRRCRSRRARATR